MSKYNKQNRLDEKAISIISDYFMNKHGDKFDLQFHGIKDNTPDTDGFLRLREPEENPKLKGTYLNNVVFFQLKGFDKKIKIPNLNPLKNGKNDFVDQFYVHIKNLAKKNDFLDLPKEVLDIAIDLKNKILLVASVIYLVGKVTGAERKAL